MLKLLDCIINNTLQPFMLGKVTMLTIRSKGKFVLNCFTLFSKCPPDRYRSRCLVQNLNELCIIIIVKHNLWH